jgi:predicted MFS family arabinose efflux permease
MALTPALGYWSDRWDNKAELLMIVLLVLAVAMALIALSGDPLVVSALAVVVGTGGRWLNTLQRAIQLALATETQRTTFFMANQLPFYGGLPVGILLAMTAVQLTGSVTNAILVVSGLFALGAAIWFQHLWRQRTKRAVLLP